MKVFRAGDKVKLNNKGLDWARYPGKHKHIYTVKGLSGINAYEPNNRLTPLHRTLRDGRVVFCGLVNTDMLECAIMYAED